MVGRVRDPEACNKLEEGVTAALYQVTKWNSSLVDKGKRRLSCGSNPHLFPVESEGPKLTPAVRSRGTNGAMDDSGPVVAAAGSLKI